MGKKEFWLICPNLVEVICFCKKNSQSEGSIEYIIIYNGLNGFDGEPPVKKSQEEVKIQAARKYWKKLTNDGWKKTSPKWKI
tara:strand:+ start:8811 stop:9056 length:246 start_codon:yes stop_codon:yes gene_type:complete